MSASNGGKTRTRISLLAGSSLVAVGLSFGALALPTQAVAQTATCVPVPASGNGTAAVTYNAGTYNPGITCAYTGTGATASTAGAITVGSTAGGNGVNLAATGGDSVTWVSTAGAVTGGAQNAGPVIEATSVSGPISITTAAITGTTVQNTYGVNAVSTGGGAVSVTNTTGNVNVTSTAVGAQQQSAIRAVSTGGNGAVSVATVGTITGRVRGIEAQSSGTGALTITSTGAVNVNNVAGIAAIDARTGTGLLTINLATGSGAVNGQAGAAILTDAGGNAVIDIAAGRTAQATVASTGVLNLTSVGSTTVDNAGTINGTAAGVAIRAVAGSFSLENDGVMTGRLNLSGVTGASTVTNNGTWSFSGDSSFGVGASTLSNAGTLTVSGASTFTGLETINNGGTINLGLNTLSAPGVDFTGIGASRLLITTNLDPAGSTACGTAISGCLDLTGGTTAGVTGVVLTLSDATLGDDFNASPIVLVDVSDGTSAAGDFVLDSISINYVVDPALGGIVSGEGLFGYALRYNEDTQQHLLISAPRNAAFEFTPFIHQALTAWHASADVIAGRQADLDNDAPQGVWVRAGFDNTDRELAQSFTAGGNTFTADNSYETTTTSLIAGYDFGGSEDFYAGAHGGLLFSELEFESSDTSDELTGPTVGLYAGWRAGALSVDGAFNANLLELKRSSVVFEDSVTNIVTLGGRAEAGWRVPISDAFFVQPLVTAAYVSSNIDEVEPTGYDIAFEDVRSSRAALGLRAGGRAGA
ncbi:MAG TPA: autotransporter outer membrane beta-barrel domain-containing protein, partial [Caulobacteraceae bacterium]|nr:autotransporter outer membrane beta-barrel domain-containing protein [Caulobacteraceae bacterium]